VANVQAHALPNLANGSLDAGMVEAAIRPPNLHTPRTSLLCLENTHNRCGGATLSLAEMDALTALAKRHGLGVHLDGARIFNAQAALGAPAARIARDCDSVSFCFSKGLGCPVGSVVCGPRELIEQARRHRKMLGGGMRQAGILAAAAIHALEHNVDRLTQDHANAKRLAQGLRRHDAFRPNDPETNIVVADIVRGELDAWLRTFREAGVLAVAFGPARMRMVTHLNISADDVDEALRRVDQAVMAVTA
jgi:threonine aldolase